MKSDSHLCGSDSVPGRSTNFKTTNLKGDYYNGITRRREDNR